jgi:hypothetical protein
MRQAWMRRRRFVAQVMWIGVWTAASVAHAQAQAVEPLRVERELGSETCPDAAELAARVQAIRGQAPAAESSYFVQFARLGRVYSAVLRSGTDGSSLRNLESPAADCAALAQATAVTLALLFDADAARVQTAPVPAAPLPAAPPEPPPPAAATPEPPPPPRSKLGVSIGAGLAEGVLRPWAPALLGEVAFVHADLRLGLGAWWIPLQDSKLGPGTIALGLVAASTRVCYAAFRRPWLQVEGCSGFALGSISAAASGFMDRAQDKHRLFAALPLELAFGQASPHASWQLSAALLLPFRRNQFSIDGLGRVYDTPALAALLSLRVAGWIAL